MQIIHPLENNKPRRRGKLMLATAFLLKSHKFHLNGLRMIFTRILLNLYATS